MATVPTDILKRKAARSATLRSKAMETDISQRKPRRITTSKRAIDFAGIYKLGPIVRIQQAEIGLPATDVIATARSMNVTENRVIDILKFAKTTIARKIAANRRLTRDESERLLGLQMLIGQVETMVCLYGNSIGFDAPTWVDHFLAAPCAALGSIKPETLMPSSEGRQLVADLVSRMAAGVYS